MAKNNGEITESKVGRPTKMTEDVVKKLEAVYKLGVTDETACKYTGISRQTLNTWYKTHPVFLDRIQKAKEFVRIASGQVVVNAIVQDRDVEAAKWWLEKKHSDEFGGQPSILQQFNVEGSDMDIEFVVDDRFSVGEDKFGSHEDKTTSKPV